MQREAQMYEAKNLSLPLLNARPGFDTQVFVVRCTARLCDPIESEDC